MKKYIDVTREVRQDIIAAFNVTGKMVYYADIFKMLIFAPCY